MKYNLILGYLFVNVGVSVALLFNDNRNDIKWDGLRVKFGPPDSNHYYSLPRTATEALNQQYVKVSECDESKWKGFRYVKDDDYSMVLLFDVNGFISGIQTAVPPNQQNGYPSKNIQPPFVKDDDDRWIISAYFVDPAIICTTGRTLSDFNNQGTGTNLYYQNGNNPLTDSLMLPRRESGLKGTKWVRTRCFYTMGVHYFYDLSRGMNCDDVLPIFILYNKGELTGLGWAMLTDLPSPHLEHAPWFTYQFFLKPVPTCLPRVGRISSLHIYLTDNVFQNVCFGNRFKGRFLN